MHDEGGDLDDLGSPGAGLADAEHFRQGLIVACGVQEVHGGGVQQKAEEVGHETMTTQAVHVQAIFHLVHAEGKASAAVFAFPALDVIVVLELAVIG